METNQKNIVKKVYVKLRVSFYFDRKRNRTKTFASVYVYKTKCN